MEFGAGEPLSRAARNSSRSLGVSHAVSQTPCSPFVVSERVGRRPGRRAGRSGRRPSPRRRRWSRPPTTCSVAMSRDASWGAVRRAVSSSPSVSRCRTWRPSSREPPLDRLVVEDHRLVAPCRVPVLLGVEHLLARPRQRVARGHQRVADRPVVGLPEQRRQVALGQERGADDVRAEHRGEVAGELLERAGAFEFLGHVLREVGEAEAARLLRDEHVLQHQRGGRPFAERRRDEVAVLGAEPPGFIRSARSMY